MEERIYTLEINDNITVSNVKKNGIYYVSDTNVDTSEWPKSFHMKATSDTGEVIYNHDNTTLENKFTVQNEEDETVAYWLEFRLLNRAEIENLEQDAKISAVDDTALAGLMATTDLYEDLLAKGVLD
jgi:hypothetical protein